MSARPTRASLRAHTNVDGKKPQKPSAKTKTVVPRTKRKFKPVDCTCLRGDDGSPMVYCAECRIWYHFTCVDISEREAAEISVYVCPSCTQLTGRRSAMEWEGPLAIEETSDKEHSVIAARKVALNARRQSNHQTQQEHLPEELRFKFDIDESDNDDDSEDDYVEGKGEQTEATTRTRRLPSASVSAGESDDGSQTDKVKPKRRRLTRHKASPAPASPVSAHVPHLKRKANNSATRADMSPAPPTKRKRSGTSTSVNATAADDPARKYCLGKFEEMFKEVFLRYPHVHTVDSGLGDSMDVVKDEEDMVGQVGEGRGFVKKTLEDLTEEEKESVIQESVQFAHELENCVFEIYAEPDKSGQLHAGGKYKDRFRMLQFNLSKPDRIMIHQRITSGNISAKEISLMSSTDLADEETKQSIKLAEKEALEQTILLKSTVPRAKITHKGLQDIEDIHGETASAREIEKQKEREQEEEERREREIIARLRTNQPNRARTMSMSIPPESPTSSAPMQSPTTAESFANQQQALQQGEQPWGGPPPVPLHAMGGSLSEHEQLVRPPLFLQSSSDFIVPQLSEPELSLNELINIDDDQDAGSSSITAAPPVNPNPTESTSMDSNMSLPSPVSAVSATGISPFAQRARQSSFDLNALWNAPRDTTSATSEAAPSSTPEEGDSVARKGEDIPQEDDNMELESVEANDQDFDMFLDEPEAGNPDSEQPLIISKLPPNVEALPQVWSGKVTMPLDSTVPQETALIARQIAGKALPADSPLWKTLFPTDTLRIEGRVPTENSIKYLMQMRMNPTKELYAAAFAPAAPENQNDFKIFCNFLISKSRHGLVFPWGSRPKDYHPGRELYMIPLMMLDPFPEFLELLEGLTFPKDRSKDYIIGVWIINKGKLAPLPSHVHPPHHAVPPPGMPPLATTEPHPAVPSLPPAVRMPPIPTGVNIAPAALAAEVASLTPEQIQSVLRALTSTNPLPLPVPAPQVQAIPPPHMPPFPPHLPPTGQQANQPWLHHPPPPNVPSAGAPPFPVNFPPPNVPFQQQHRMPGEVPPLPQSQPHPLNGPSSYERHDYGRPDLNYDRPKDFDRGHGEWGDQRRGGGGGQFGDRNRDRDRDFGGPRGHGGDRGRKGGSGRGGRGGGGGRGRGGGGGRGGHDMHDWGNDQRRGDSGWPKRQRNEGQPW